MLFLIYVDDLAKALECYGITAILFPDDVKVYLEINSPDDCVYLQTVLDVITWTSKWQLSISVSKCNLLSVSDLCCERDYHTNDNKLPHCFTCYGLGIKITFDLLHLQHVHDVVLKANQREIIL